MGTIVKSASCWINFTHYPHFFLRIEYFFIVPISKSSDKTQPRRNLQKGKGQKRILSKN